MSENYNETDPERKIFRTALNSLQIRPSEKFWNTALNDIVDKAGVASKKRVRTWQVVSLALGSALVLFILHDVTVNSKMDKMEQEIAAIKNTQNKLVENNTNTENKSNQAQNVTSSAISAVNTDQSAANANNQGQKNAAAQQPKGAQYIAKTGAIYNNNRVTRNTAASNTLNNVNAPFSAQQGNNNSANTTQNNATGVEDNSVISPKVPVIPSDNASSEPSNSNKVADVQQKHQDTAKRAVSDTTSILAANIPPKPSLDLHHKFFVSAFFAPGGLNDFLEDRDNDDNDDVTVNSLKSRETDWFSYKAGLNAGIDITSKLSLRTGFYYDLYTYNIKQTIITAQPQNDGAIGYSIVTSSGVVNMPYTASAVKVGDSVKVRGSSSRGYLCIPLQFTYLFATDKKFGFYITAGAVADISFYTNTELNWENTFLQEGDVEMSKVQGLKEIDYAYTLGFGVKYKVWQGFSVYGEPFLQGSLTSINKGTPISIYPYFFGAAIGVSYHW